MGTWPLPQRLSTLVGMVLLSLYVIRGDDLAFAGFVIFGLVGLGPTALKKVHLSRTEVALTFRAQSAEIARALDQKAAQVSDSNDELTVTPDVARLLSALADALRRQPPSSPEDFADLATSTVSSAGSVLPGQLSQRIGALTVKFKRPLPTGTTTISVALETPGVILSDRPFLTSAVPGTVRVEPDARTLTIKLNGPTAVPPMINISGLGFSIDRDARPGSVKATFSVNGRAGPALATLATIARPDRSIQ